VLENWRIFLVWILIHRNLDGRCWQQLVGALKTPPEVADGAHMTQH
jgi:hypothetical protein